MKKQQCRAGSVLVESAICIPVFVLVLFAAIEFSRANQLRHTVDTAAYEAARNGIVPGATSNDCKATAERILKACGARDYTITVTPSTINDYSSSVRVTIELPMNSNSYVTGRFLGNKVLVASSTKARENLSNYKAITEPTLTGVEPPVIPTTNTTTTGGSGSTGTSGSTGSTSTSTNNQTTTPSTGTTSGSQQSNTTPPSTSTNTNTTPAPIPFDY